MNGQPNVLELHAVSKIYADRAVLNRANLDIPAGSVVGLLGKNGAGKTTLLRWRWAWPNPTTAPPPSWAKWPGT